jgi:DNA polymerase-4
MVPTGNAPARNRFTRRPQLAAKIFATARELLAREIDGTAFRLIGTGVSALEPGSQADDILFREDQMDDAALNVQRLVERVARGLLTHEGIPF